MDAGPVTVSGPSGHAVSQWLRLPIRRLRTGDTLRTFANGDVARAQHSVDPLGIQVGFGVQRLLIGLEKVTDVRKLLVKFTKCRCLFFTCKFACEKKFPEIMYFSAYDFKCEIIEVKSILISVGQA